MLFFFLLFSYTKSEDRRAEQALPQGFDTSGRGKEVGKWWRRVHMVQILLTLVYKWGNNTY
jgi:hypothetical protein